jgi:hypothetical protein
MKLFADKFTSASILVNAPSFHRVNWLPGQRCPVEKICPPFWLAEKINFVIKT